jgi:hypothetical protein
LRIGYRFPSSEIGASRFTDAPGYYFDVSFAKGFHSHPALKWIVMAGGYFWQAEIRRHPQDDAFLLEPVLNGTQKISGSRLLSVAISVISTE